jgi:two-component system OmpR family sensor kinase
MTRSLRGRLFIGLAVVVVLAALAAGGLVYRWSFDEAIELQDAILQQVGAVAIRQRLQPSITVPPGVEPEDQVLIEEPGRASEILGKLGLPALPADLADGLQTVARGADQWRVLVLSRADGRRVAVSQRAAYREEIAHGAALRALLPNALLVPGLMLLVAVVIAHGFRPLSKLAAQLNVRTSDHLARLPLEDMPNELRPFIRSINRLLERIEAMFDRQRRFIADAAHELRTPLTALSLHAENLAPMVVPEGRDRLVALQSGIRRAGHLLEQLLALARHEGSPGPRNQCVRLDHVVREVLADLLPAAQARSIDLGCKRMEDVEVRSDPTSLNVMIRNLVDNALRYTPSGGCVDIDLHREDGQAVFRVEDTGPGITPAELSQVFEPFFRGSSVDGEGSGLGLSIVRHVVDTLSATIELENIVASGRTGLRVSVKLPVS